MAHTYNPNYMVGGDWEDCCPEQARHKCKTLFRRIKEAQRVGRMVQVVKCLPMSSKCKALTLNTITRGKRKKEKRKKRN
jgi:hypothetical protein